MANILGLALKVTGDASGLAKSLTPVDRALDNLAKQADKATAVFKPLTEASAGAARAQEQFGERFANLAAQLKAGAIAEKEYAAAFGQLTEEAKSAADAFREGLRITQQNQTAEQARTASLERLNELLKMGAIDARNFGIESAKLSEGSNSTALDRFAEAIAPLRAAFEGGALSAQRFAEQSREIAAAISGSTPAAERQATAILDLRDRFDAGRISIEQYREEFSRIQSGDIATTFEVTVVGVREGVEATERLRETIATLSSTQVEAAVKVSGQDSLDALRAQFAGLDGTQIDALLRVLGVDSVEAARTALDSLQDTSIEAIISVSGLNSLDEVRNQFASLDGQQIDAVLQVLGVDSVEAAKAALSTLTDTQIDAVVSVSGLTSLDEVRQQFAAIDGQRIDAVLNVLGVESIEAAQAKLAALDASSVTVEAQLQTAGFDSIDKAKELLNSLQDKNVTATAKALGVDSIEQLVGVIRSVEPKTVEVTTNTNADETAAKIRDLVAEQEAWKNAMAEGARLAEQYSTEEEKRAKGLERLNELIALGAVEEQTAARARAELSGDAARLAAEEQKIAAARADAARITAARLAAEEQKIAAARADAARITAANMAPMEAYDREVQQLTAHLNSGRISQETFDRAVAKATATFTKAESAANGYDKTVGNVGLKFNEVSGVLSALPGPLGSFAGRLSGLASAGEGLSRVFGAGLSQGLTTIGASVAGLVNPFTAAVAGVAAFGAAATAVVHGLTSLEDRVEKLGNTADKLGVSFEFIQTLEAAATRSGTSIDAVSAAFGRLQKSVLGVDEESKSAQKALAEIGVTSEELAALSPEEQYLKIGQSLAAIEDPARRTATSIALFGKSGADLLPFFRNLPGAAVDMERFGRALTVIDRRRIDEFGAGLDALGVATQGLGQSLLLPFVGLGEGVATAFAEITAGLTAIIDPIGQVLEPILTNIGRLVEVIGITLGTLGRVLGETISRVVTIITTAFGKIGEVIGNTLGSVAEYVGSAVTSFTEFTGLGNVISSFAETVSAAFGSLWDGIKAIVGQVGGFIEQVLKFAEDWLGIVPEIEQPVTATVDVNDGGAIAELVKESKTLQGTLDGITKNVSDAISESAKFGQAGFDAALRYQTSIDELKAKLDAGLFNEETFRREAEKAGVAFKSELAKIEENAQLDIQINADAEKTLAGLQQQINKAVEGARQFGQAGFEAAAQFQDKLRDLGAQFEDGRINAATLAAETEKATAEYNKQIEGLKQIEELQKRTLEAERNRIAELLKAGDTTTQLERDIETVQREQLRLEEEIRKQREAGNVMAADAAAARLAQLDQLQAKLDDQQQAVDQGFAEGFTKAFDATAKSIDGLIVKAEQFGNVGAMAGEALRQGVASAQQQVKDGILTAETYQKEVDRQQELFNQRLAAAQRVEEFLRGKLDERQKAELDAVAQVEERRKQAARNVEAIEAKMLEERQKLEKARQDGDLAAARAAKTRLDQLGQAQRVEQNVANGRAAGSTQQARQIASGFNAVAAEFTSAANKQIEQFGQATQQSVDAANFAIAKTQEAAAKQAAKTREMLTLGPTSVQTADVRTQQGAAIVIGLAAEAQDPALIEARLQTRALKAIRDAIVEGTNAAPVPVRI